MVAGTLAKAGYFMGDALYPARHSNPKGFFEDPEINDINEQILSLVRHKDIPLLARIFKRKMVDEHFALADTHRWLDRVPFGTKISSAPEINERIRKAAQRAPFCFKDPRFSYTLPVWRPFLKDCVFICVFREPAATAKSIVKECQDIDHLRSEKMSFQIALEIWTLMYRHILEVQSKEGQWLFIHFNQVLAQDGLDRLEQFTGAPVDRSFPDAAFRRSLSDRSVGSEAMQMYKTLCGLAGYKD